MECGGKQQKSFTSTYTAANLFLRFVCVFVWVTADKDSIRITRNSNWQDEKANILVMLAFRYNIQNTHNYIVRDSRCDSNLLFQSPSSIISIEDEVAFCPLATTKFDYSLLALRAIAVDSNWHVRPPTARALGEVSNAVKHYIENRKTPHRIKFYS